VTKATEHVYCVLQETGVSIVILLVNKSVLHVTNLMALVHPAKLDTGVMDAINCVAMVVYWAHVISIIELVHLVVVETGAVVVSRSAVTDVLRDVTSLTELVIGV